MKEYPHRTPEYLQMLKDSGITEYEPQRFLKTVRYDRPTRGRDFLSLGPTPTDEDCTQAGEDTTAQKIECRAYINQLVRVYGEPPDTLEFCIVKNDHDFGAYYEAGISFPDTDEDEIEGNTEAQDKFDAMWNYINAVEKGTDTWDDEAKAELYEAGHPRYIAKIIKLKRA